MSEEQRLEGLRAAIELSPDNHGLRLVLAEALRGAGEELEALDHLAMLADAGALPDAELIPTGQLALRHGRLQLAARCVDAARRRGIPEGVAALLRDLEDALTDDGIKQLSVDPDIEGDDRFGPKPIPPSDQATFGDVGGLTDVKQAIHRTIILPFQRPDLYERYGRRSGGGVLLYGPPGCGKTLLARATAGECGLPFLNVRIEEVLDPYIGVSEANLHAAFESARASAPCVLFLDELDAIAYARRKQQGSGARALVDQLLQELDAIGADNSDVLVLAATNAPWDVDDAPKRPGRFDRMVFVPPPDLAARERILEQRLADPPTAELDLAALATRAALFSGADVTHWVERAIDLAIDETLARGGDVPITSEHMQRALEGLTPTTLDWLSTARNYVEFANESGRFDDVLAYLETDEVKSRRRRGLRKDR
ncbi:MAG: Cell division protein FtsH [uncultured Solirubrobacteraceae bacterium]|uniref:Cell division protein FtsH n=1 Tax=uncultured Solirubrobacteraceae bacterium TaxID=1162706 RepID=A0A6J4SF32_9ACTN|nr:MAG: Cell division protein FtsH [uncultured Solirubrobacteraceae bacterium]